VLGVALLLRALLPTLGYLHTHDVTIFYTPDSASYIVPARELIAHHRFFSNGKPEILRTPGYPLVLTVGLLLGHLAFATIVLQILLSCFTVYLVYETTCLLFGQQRIAVVAAALYAIEPFSVLFTSQLAPETLFTAIVMLGVYYLVKYLRRQSLGYLLASGIALAASVYVRPIGYFLPPIVTVGLIAWSLLPDRQHKMRIVAHAMTFVIVSCVLISSWQLRNKIESGYSGFSTIASDNMYFIMAASVLAAEQRVPYYGMRGHLGYQNQRVYFQANPEQRNWSVAHRAEYRDRTGEHVLLESPATFARIYFDGVLRASFDPGSTEFLRFFDLYPKQGGLLHVEVDKGIVKTLETALRTPLLFWSIVALLPLQFIYLACTCVTVSSRASRDAAIFAVLLIAGYYMAIAGGPGDWGRFRHPVMPIVCVVAGYGLSEVWNRLRRTDSRLVSGALQYSC
jgi:4-amino-4-deoxy-L-arabinose transferase-like glycosyltransferase